jgi:spermidine synthase
LITKDSKTSLVYRNEAAGAVAGGLLILLFAYAGLGNFTLLLLVSGVEFSMATRGKYRHFLIPTALLILGVFAGPWLDRTGLNLRWPGFETEKTAHGFSGLWAVHARGSQLTVSHNGRFTHTIPDRQSSEEALLWPLLYRPEAREILLVGFEGIDAASYLPGDIAVTGLISDKAFLRLGVGGDARNVMADPLSYSPDKKYDVINLYLESGGDLGDYRLETEFFFSKCKGLLEREGVLFVSASSDENYISPPLGKYLSGIYGSLVPLFDSVAVIPGTRIGFVGYDGESGRPLEALRQSRIESPYFNEPLIINRLLPFRIDYLKDQLVGQGANNIFRPATAVDFLQWLGSMFGRGKYLFQIYKFPYPLLFFPALLAIPAVIGAVRKSAFLSYLSVSLLGSLGLGTEIAVIFLFQILFGRLYMQLGLILALFMAGMAAGAHYRARIGSYVLAGPFIILLILLSLMPDIIKSDIGLTLVPLILYVAAAAAGFYSGGGFAILAERRPADRSWGATLYGVELYGALTAAVFVPGMILALGMAFLLWILIAIGLIISATLWYLGR